MDSKTEWVDSLNLPMEISHLCRRRYSDPCSSKTTAETHQERPRRFSLSTFDDLKDISSGKIRSCVGKILASNGFTASAQAKTNQMRRYSVHVDPEVENNLGQCRKSFFKMAESAKRACSSNSSHRPMVDRRTSLTSYMPKHTQEGVRTKRRKSSATKLEQRPPTPDSYYMDPRKLKQLRNQELECPIFPKCSYKLRDNGMLASELVSTYGIQIEAVPGDNDMNAHNRPQSSGNTPKRRLSFSPHCSERRSSTASSSRKHCSVKSQLSTLSTGSVSLAGELSPDLYPNPGEDPMSRSQQQSAESFYKRKSVHYSPDTEASRWASVVSPMISDKPSTSEKIRKSLLRGKSKSTFEFIGNPAMHGSPTCTGRLKLCTFRSPEI